jgi:hypothetical protein
MSCSADGFPLDPGILIRFLHGSVALANRKQLLYYTHTQCFGKSLAFVLYQAFLQEILRNVIPRPLERDVNVAHQKRDKEQREIIVDEFEHKVLDDEGVVVPTPDGHRKCEQNN